MLGIYCVRKLADYRYVFLTSVCLGKAYACIGKDVYVHETGADTEKIDKGRISEGLRAIWMVCLEILPWQKSNEKQKTTKHNKNN